MMVVLFSMVSVSLSVNTSTREPLRNITKFSGHHPMVEREAKFENGLLWGVRVVRKRRECSSFFSSLSVCPAT